VARRKRQKTEKMQRRTLHRPPSAKKYSFSSSVPEHNLNDNGKIKSRKVLSLKSLLCVVVIVFGIGAFLTPSQKKELVQAEHLVEQKVEEWLYNQPQPPQRNEKSETPPKLNIRSLPKPNETIEKKPEPPPPPPPPPPPKIEPEPEKLQEKDNGNFNPNRLAGRMEAHSISWVDREKALKKKLQVLFDMQKKGDSLGVPVLTRYLGEDFPAFVGTPGSTMKEEEFKKLVEAKYEEMRKEEEEWQKKMTLLIEAQKNERRDMGITTA